jgi:hypothetical protein
MTNNPTQDYSNFIWYFDGPFLFMVIKLPFVEYLGYDLGLN